MAKQQEKRTAKLNGQGNINSELRINWSIGGMPLRKKNKVVGVARMRDMRVSELLEEIIDEYFNRLSNEGAQTTKTQNPSTE